MSHDGKGRVTDRRSPTPGEVGGVAPQEEAAATIQEQQPRVSGAGWLIVGLWAVTFVGLLAYELLTGFVAKVLR